MEESASGMSEGKEVEMAEAGRAAGAPSSSLPQGTGDGPCSSPEGGSGGGGGASNLSGGGAGGVLGDGGGGANGPDRGAAIAGSGGGGGGVINGAEAAATSAEAMSAAGNKGSALLTGPPARGARRLVCELLPELLPPLIKDLTEWTVAQRLCAARSMLTTLVLAGEGVTSHLTTLIPALCSAIGDESTEKVCREWVEGVQGFAEEVYHWPLDHTHFFVVCCNRGREHRVRCVSRHIWHAHYYAQMCRKYAGDGLKVCMGLQKRRGVTCLSTTLIPVLCSAIGDVSREYVRVKARTLLYMNVQKRCRGFSTWICRRGRVSLAT
ncbi:hypothetical protein DUNSADRAFT_1744 [Dunaliella salina]|uniref:Dynein axonemal assembly factor 5 HEAT-repeat domain-containing protein n=1 Tax=Dunaliella salina TaxID=3046 RepID=A0ABQ7GWQ7_DUNSA|nr:hypothetical protein DUNSADRAFT_1744 [Dunaliella salina]|eukprot:KAF5839047.1 hypothetical protein DUNSADRAFT_1744 [Dunaliella salina]